MSSKAVQRQGNYRAFCEKQMAYLRENLADRPADERDAYLSAFQTKLDEMFTQIPGIADTQANFDNACKHIAYQMAMESDELTDEQKAQFTGQRMQQLADAPKNWLPLVLVVVVVIVVIVALTQITRLF